MASARKSNRIENFPVPPSAFRLPISAFTLAEIMVAMAIGMVVCAISMYGILFFQKSYAATEQYALSMTDQMRVLDYLSMDLRRAVAVTVDNTNSNLTMTLPSYYSYNGPSDPGHVSPQPVLPLVSADAEKAVYAPGAGPGTATPGVWYRFDAPTNSLRRREYFTDGTDGGWQTIATQIKGFPQITAETPQKYTVTVTFTPAFQTLDTPESNVITLSSTIYLRNPLSGQPAMAPH